MHVFTLTKIVWFYRADHVWNNKYAYYDTHVDLELQWVRSPLFFQGTLSSYQHFHKYHSLSSSENVLPSKDNWVWVLVGSDYSDITGVYPRIAFNSSVDKPITGFKLQSIGTECSKHHNDIAINLASHGQSIQILNDIYAAFKTYFFANAR